MKVPIPLKCTCIEKIYGAIGSLDAEELATLYNYLVEGPNIEFDNSMSTVSHLENKFYKFKVPQ